MRHKRSSKYNQLLREGITKRDIRWMRHQAGLNQEEAEAVVWLFNKGRTWRKWESELETRFPDTAFVELFCIKTAVKFPPKAPPGWRDPYETHHLRHAGDAKSPLD